MKAGTCAPWRSLHCITMRQKLRRQRHLSDGQLPCALTVVTRVRRRVSCKVKVSRSGCRVVGAAIAAGPVGIQREIESGAGLLRYPRSTLTYPLTELWVRVMESSAHIGGRAIGAHFIFEKESCTLTKTVVQNWGSRFWRLWRGQGTLGSVSVCASV